MLKKKNEESQDVEITVESIQAKTNSQSAANIDPTAPPSSEVQENVRALNESHLENVENQKNLKKSKSKTGAAKAPMSKMSNVEPLEHAELNLDREYWAKKFLYPFALDPAPIKLSEYPVQGMTVGGPATDQPKIKADEKIDILDSSRFNFPLSHLDHKEEYLQDIVNPLQIQQKEILADMY